MLVEFLRSLNAGPLNVRISRRRLRVTNVTTFVTWEDEPLVALDDRRGRPVVTGVGSTARSKGGTLLNPFEHPRILVADIPVAEKLLQHVFREVLRPRWVTPAPVVVLQVTEKLEGGVTALEWRALEEIARAAGARAVHLSKDRLLSDEEIRRGVGVG